MAIYLPVPFSLPASLDLPLLIEDASGQEIVCETLDDSSLIGRAIAADVVLGATPGEEVFPEAAMAVVDLLVAIRSGRHHPSWIRLGSWPEPREAELTHRRLLALDEDLSLLIGDAVVTTARRTRVMVALFAPAGLERARFRIDVARRTSIEL